MTARVMVQLKGEEKVDMMVSLKDMRQVDMTALTAVKLMVAWSVAVSAVHSALARVVQKER